MFITGPSTKSVADDVFVTGSFLSLIANAGPDQNVIETSSVNLDGTASVGATSYLWTQTAGSSVSLTGDTTDTPSFTAPTLSAANFGTVSSANSAGTAVTEITVNAPVDASNGDLLIAFVAHRGSGGTDAPVGWSKIGERVSGAQDSSISIFTRLHDGSASYTWSGWSAKKTCAAVVKVSGVRAIVDGDYADDANNLSSIDLPAITSRNAPGAAIWAIAGQSNLSPATTTAGVTELYDDETTGSGSVGIWVGFQNIGSAGGTVDPGAITPAGSTPYTLIGVPVLGAGEAEALSFQLEVGDGSNTATDSVTINVDPTTSSLPYALFVGANHPSICPFFVDNGSKLYFSGNRGDTGASVVGSYDGSIDKMFTVADFGGPDDHIASAIVADSDKPPMVAYVDHSNDSLMRVRVGSVNDDLTSLGAESTVTIAANATYINLWRRPSTNEVHAFVRSTTSWWHTYTTDWGTSWSTAQEFFDGSATSGNLWYMQSTQTSTGDVNCIFYTGSADDTVHYCKLDLATGDIESADGTVLDNLKTPTSLPVLASEIDTAATAGVGNGLRGWYAAETSTPTILYCEGDSVDDSGGQYKVARWNGSSWDTVTVTSTGDRIRAGDGSLWYGGGSFSKGVDNELLLSVENSGTWTIERWTTTDYSSWTKAETLISGSEKVGRPLALTSYYGFTRYATFNNYNDFDAQLEIWPL